MDKNLHTTYDYKKMIELQANQTFARIECNRNIDKKYSSKSKVKTIVRRNAHDKRK